MITYENLTECFDNLNKKEIDKVFNSNKDYSLPPELYCEIEAINDTEILYQQIDRYVNYKSDEIYKQLR